MKGIKSFLLSLFAFVVALAAPPSFAVAPAYVSDALTAAQTTFTDYITAAAPGVFTIVTIMAGVFLIVKLVKKSTH